MARSSRFPSTSGGVSISYNVPGVASDCKLTPSVLSDIFLGTVKTWNDSDDQEA